MGYEIIELVILPQKTTKNVEGHAITMVSVSIVQPSLNQEFLSHWTYWLQILSKLCFQRVALPGNYEIVAISTDKNTFLNDLNYKADIGQHFHKSEKSARFLKFMSLAQKGNSFICKK